MTQRRRARDRQINKRTESVKPMPVVRPLTVNPLRASGPIRRTCGVIKLPVTWVAPPDDDQGGTNLNSLTPGEQKSQIHVIVQSLWEKRLFGVKPYDHVTGDEIAAEESDSKVEVKPITPIISKPHSPRTISPVPSFSHSPSSGGNITGGGSIPIKSAPSIIPLSPFRQQASLSTGSIPSSSSLLPSLLQSVTHSKMVEPQRPDSPPVPSAPPNISVIQQTGQPIIVPQPSSSPRPSYSTAPPAHQRLAISPPQHRFSPTTTHFSNGINTSSSKPPIAPVAPMVTDRELQLQEERVRLLRQQLLAAASAGGGTTQRSS